VLKESSLFCQKREKKDRKTPLDAPRPPPKGRKKEKKKEKDGMNGTNEINDKRNQAK